MTKNTVVVTEEGKVKFSSLIEAALFSMQDDDFDFDMEVETFKPIHRKGKKGGKGRKFDERKAGRKQKMLEQKFYAEYAEMES